MINLRYKIIRNLGKGRSTVFLCKDIELPGVEFAMKILPSNVDEYEKEKFIKEYFTLRNLQHPNIIKAFDFGTIHKTDGEEGITLGSTFFTLEYFEGRELLSDSFVHSENDLREIIKQICAALYYLHQSKYIYYDLKPENILVSIKTEIRQVRLIDMGLAEYSPSVSDYEIKGTAHYIAPELLKKEKHNHSVDLYSLGMIMYRLIYDRFPFNAIAELDIYKAIIEDEYELPESKRYSGELIQIINKLIEKNRDVRYSSALSIIHDLGFEINIELTKEFLPARIFSGRDAIINQILSFIKKRESNEVYTVSGFEGVGKSSLFHKIIELDRTAILITDVKGKSLEDLVRYILKQILFSDAVYRHLSENNREYFLNILGDESYDIINDFKSLIAILSTECNFAILFDDFNHFDQLVSNLILEVMPILQVNNIKVILSESSEREFLAEKINNLTRITLSSFTSQELIKFLDESYYADFPKQKLKDVIIKNADLIPGNIKSFINDLILFRIIVFAKNGVDFTDKEEKLEKLSEAHFAVYDLRLSNISNEEIITAQLLSAFDIYLDQHMLSEFLKKTQDQIQSMIDILQLNNIIQKQVAGQTLVFTSEALKKYIYASIDDKKSLHHNIALKLANQFNGFNRLELARHYELADEFEDCFNVTMEEISEAEKHSTYGYMQKVLEHLVKIPLKEENSNISRIKLCEVYLKLGDVQSALNTIKELKNRSVHKKIENKLFILEARALIASGDFTEGKRLISRLLKEIDEENERNRLKVELAYTDFELKLYQEAKQQCEALLKDKSFTAELKGRCFNLLGMISIYQNNDLKSALKNFEDAKTQFEESKQPIRISGAEVNIGNVYNILSEFEKAEEHLQNASKINQSIGNLDQEGLLMQNMGAFYVNRNDFESAIKSYQKAHNIFLSIGNEPGRAIVLWDLGEIYTLSCEYDLALKSLNEAESIFIQMKNHSELLDDLFMKGKLYYKIGEFQKLEQIINNFHSNMVKYNLTQSHNVFEKLLFQLKSAGTKQSLSIANLELIRKEMIHRKDIQNYIEVNNLIIEFYLSEKNYYTATSELNQTEFIELCSQNSILEAQREYFLGIISKNIKSDSLLPPIMYFEKSYDLIKEKHITELTWKVLFQISELYIERGNLTKAKFYVTYTRELIYFIGEKIESPQLRATYLRNPERMDVLRKLESFYPSN